MLKHPPVAEALARTSRRRVALVCGVDTYLHEQFNDLGCAVNDARSVAAVLNAHEFAPFDVAETLLDQEVTRAAVRRRLQTDLAQSIELYLLYFAGHGARSGDSGLLVTHDGQPYDEGVSFRDLASWIKGALADQVVVIHNSIDYGSERSFDFLTYRDGRTLHTNLRSVV